jgi:PAS domain S-box-containing protein
LLPTESGRSPDLEKVELPVVQEELIALRAAPTQEDKQLQKELELSRSLLLGALEVTTDGILVTQNASYIATFNPKFVGMWGIPPSIMASQDLRLVLPAILEQLKDPLAFERQDFNFLSQSATQSYGIFELKDGRIFECYFQTQRLGENIVGRVYSFRDITLARALGESEQRYRAVVKQTSEGIILFDLISHRLLEANAACCNLLGYTNTEILNLRFEDILLSDHEILERLQADIETEKHLIKESRLRCQNNSVLDVEVSLSLISYGPKEIVCAVIRNITEQKLVEKALIQAKAELEIKVQERTAKLLKTNKQLMSQILERQRAEKAAQENEAKYRSVVDNVKEVIFQTNSSGIWTFLNPAWTEITGFSLNESLGKSVSDYVHPDDRERYLQLFRELIEGQGKYCQDEIRYLTADGGYRWIEVNARLTLDANGFINGTSGTLNDITSRKQAEIEIRKAMDKEKELVELKSKFITMVSHDFRTPLTVIYSYSDLLKKYSYKYTEEKKQQHLDKIKETVKSMTKLLDNVLLIGKIGSENIEFLPVPLNLEEFCRECLSEISVAATQKHFFNFSCSGECSLVNCDKDLLRQIINNLLGNAVKYSPQGGTVYLNIACNQREIILQIQDSGIGIPESDKKRLFEKFYRASNVDNISGTGLGMAIIKQAVDLHGGSINFESEEGVGTTFTVCLPSIQLKDE